MENYVIRKAKQEDSKRIWQIRNQPFIRKYSNNSEIIPYQKHVGWFQKKYFSEQDNHCLVLEDKNKNNLIGYCRLDFDKPSRAYNVSIALDSKFQGRGLGHKLLSHCLVKFRKDKSIIAEVLKGNKRSVNLFKKNKFELYKQDDKNYYLKLKA